jgi:hypothetical protein
VIEGSPGEHHVAPARHVRVDGVEIDHVRRVGRGVELERWS